MKKKTRKMDPYFVSRQRWELRYVAYKLDDEGYPVLVEDVKDAIKAVGKSRKKVYNWLRKNC